MTDKGDPTGLTVPCTGCGDPSPHDSHLAPGALDRLGGPRQDPAVAAAGILEAAGVEPANRVNPNGEDYTLANADEDVSLALFLLRRALAIRERHARPKVTDAQVESVRAIITTALGSEEATERLVAAGWTPPDSKDGGQG